MKRMTWLVWPLMVSTFLLFSCSGSFMNYRRDIFEGKQLYGSSDYASARSSFLRASQEERTPESLAWAATSSYKMNDLGSAERLVRDAQFIDYNSFSSLRIRGYKALILLAENRKPEGIQALREYLDLYERLDPLMNVRDVERMAQTGDINLPVLERLIDEQVGQYESDIEQLYETGTGYYGQKWESFLGF